MSATIWHKLRVWADAFFGAAVKDEPLPVPVFHYVCQLGFCESCQAVMDASRCPGCTAKTTELWAAMYGRKP